MLRSGNVDRRRAGLVLRFSYDMHADEPAPPSWVDIGGAGGSAAEGGPRQVRAATTVAARSACFWYAPG
jgi:hypothetical protein